MEKAFNRRNVSEISQKVTEVLSDFFKSGSYEFSIDGGNFTADEVKLNLKVHMKDSDGGIIVSDTTHAMADSAASRVGLKFSGHLIGSTWNIRGKIYTVTGYAPTRRAYPLSLKKSDGSISKAAVTFLSSGVQVIYPTLSEFTKWFTLDPDSDAILESDAEICDRVQLYLETNYYTDAETDKFFELVDTLNEEGLARRWAKRAYELLFKERNSMETAYLGLKVLYESLAKEAKPKNVRK